MMTHTAITTTMLIPPPTIPIPTTAENTQTTTNTIMHTPRHTLPTATMHFPMLTTTQQLMQARHPLDMLHTPTTTLTTISQTSPGPYYPCFTHTRTDLGGKAEADLK